MPRGEIVDAYDRTWSRRGLDAPIIIDKGELPSANVDTPDWGPDLNPAADALLEFNSFHLTSIFDIEGSNHPLCEVTKGTELLSTLEVGGFIDFVITITTQFKKARFDTTANLAPCQQIAGLSPSKEHGEPAIARSIEPGDLILGQSPKGWAAAAFLGVEDRCLWPCI